MAKANAVMDNVRQLLRMNQTAEIAELYVPMGMNVAMASALMYWLILQTAELAELFALEMLRVVLELALFGMVVRAVEALPVLLVNYVALVYVRMY